MKPQLTLMTMAIAATFAGCSGGGTVAGSLPPTTTQLSPLTPDSSLRAASTASNLSGSSAAVQPATWTTLFLGSNSKTQIYTKRSKTDPCGYVPATASSSFSFPVMTSGQTVKIVGQLVNGTGGAIPVGACPYQILSVTSVTGSPPAPSPLPSPSPTSASNYWVSTTGSDSGSGTSGTPFRTIQHAANVAQAGQIVTVEDGTYQTCGSCSGVIYNVLNAHGGTSNSARITFRAQHQNKAVIDGSRLGSSTVHCWGFNPNLAYMTITGFHLQNCAGGFAGLDGAHDVTISHNEVDHMGTTGNCGTNGGFGFTGIGGGGYNILLDSNVIHDIGEVHNSHGCSYTNDHGLYLEGHDYTIINNVFYNNNSGWDIQLKGGSTGQNWFIANNTFGARNDPQAQGNVVIWTAGGNLSNLTFQNNISAGTVAAGWLNCSLGSSASNVVVENNLIQSNIPLFYGACASTTVARNQMNVDPLFVDKAIYNFTLRAGSLALGAGTYLSRVPNNITGLVRSNPPSIGAY